jgi:hypothetical protein
VGATIPVGGPVLRNTTDILEWSMLIENYEHTGITVIYRSLILHVAADIIVSGTFRR